MFTKEKNMVVEGLRLARQDALISGFTNELDGLDQWKPRANCSSLDTSEWIQQSMPTPSRLADKRNFILQNPTFLQILG